MCGLAGSTAARADVLEAMAARLDHRGPDDKGLWLERDGGTGFAFRRLAIIDLSSRGHQPMATDDGRFVLAHNGEIYNFRDLRRELELAGETFRSASDTEVLLRLLAREGTAALPRLVGMFAFALWDRERGELLLARDRLGIKPLVYAPLPGGAIAFASEIRALAAHPGVDLGVDAEALSDYLACLYVPAPRTIHAGIRKLPPGHVLRWRAGTSSVECYWRPHVGGGKTLLKAVARRLLPKEIVERPKRGFNPPMGVWLRRDLKAMVDQRLTPETTAALGLAWEPVAAMLAEHRSGRRDHALKVWALLTLDAWWRHRPQPASAGG